MSLSDYSHSRIWQIAAPLILSNVTVPLLGIVDTAVVGHLETPVYLGAVAIGATIFSFLFMGFNFLRMGTTGVTAQALGERDGLAIRGALLQALSIAAAIALTLIAVRGPLGALALRLIEPPSAAIGAEALTYFSIRIFAAPAALANYALVGWFIGLQNGRVPLLIMLVVNSINIALDYLLVVQFGLHADGVAWASLAAEYSGVALGLTLAWRMLRAYPADTGSRLWDGGRLRRLLAVNANLLIRTMSLMFVFGAITALGARQGTVILAANAVLLNMQYFMAYALDGFANAAEALIGRAIGARDREGLARAWRNTLLWSAGVAIVFALFYLLLGRVFVNTMTGIEDVRATAYAYLPWMVLSPLLSVWCFFYDGVFVGATRAADMRNTMLVSTFGVFVPAAFALGFLDNHGLWLAFMLFMVARGATMHYLWRNTDALRAAADA